ncbi:hypothetical protein [Actinophytocola oryzae]|uniref:Uncharacterized protein n=1 Tax=Actinophytocola oryzae TaxID=502181 RepID=A0A4R7VNQ0_9PSEU|nr:hypothetical protein [Actinophytocola oryzae]TDV50968.1 hypothetical protein CLV71_106314 [Actinophytocola oryzae]
MNTLLIVLSSTAFLVFVTRFVIGKRRTRELDRDFSLELSCTRDQALLAAVAAARGVLWEVRLTDNGVRTRHLKSRNVIHVSISAVPGRVGNTCAKVWTRYTWADAVVILHPSSFTDTRRKRDRIVRALRVYETRRPRNAPIH